MAGTKQNISYEHYFLIKSIVACKQQFVPSFDLLLVGIAAEIREQSTRSEGDQELTKDAYRRC